MVNVHVLITLSFLNDAIYKHAIGCQQLMSDIQFIS